MRRRGSIVSLIIAYIVLLGVVFVGVVMLFTRPQTLGLMPEGDFNATITAAGEDIVLFEQTVTAYYGLATRQFDLDNTLQTLQADLEATATQNATAIQATREANALDITETAAAAATNIDVTAVAFADNVALTDQALVDEAFDNIAARATLEFEIEVQRSQATQDANDAINTRSANFIAATNAAANLVSTQSALESTAVALGQRENLLIESQTQVALDARSTQTQVTVNNARDATRAAEDFVGTQIAFDAEATRVELEYQGTQAALAAESTAVALSFDQTAPASEIGNGDIEPTRPGAPLIEDSNVTISDGASWRLGDPTDWRITASGNLIATDDGAWLISEDARWQAYTFELTWQPVDGLQTILLNVPTDGNSIALNLTITDNTITAGEMIAFDTTTITRNAPIVGTPIASFARVGAPADMLTITIRNRVIAVTAGDSLLLSAEYAPAQPGGVGIRTSVNTEIGRIALREAG